MDGLPELILAVGGVGGTVGMGVKFWLNRITQRQKDAETRQEANNLKVEAERVRYELRVETERLRWEAVMSDNVAEMRREIAAQERKINSQELQIFNLQRISDAYLHHISTLEGLMRNAGMDVPSLVLPRPYPQIPQIEGDR